MGYYKRSPEVKPEVPRIDIHAVVLAYAPSTCKKLVLAAM